MMMCYVGTGVGHHQPASFLREDGQLKGSLTGDSYVETATREDGESEVIQSTPMVEGGSDEDEDEDDYDDFGHDGDGDDNDDFDEEIFEM